MDEIDQPTVDLLADSSESTPPLSRHDPVVLQMKEGINEEESEGYPINLKDCNLQPLVKPQPMKAMAAVPSSDTKLLKQQLKPLPYVTDNEALLSSEPKHFLLAENKWIDQGDVELLNAMPVINHNKYLVMNKFLMLWLRS